MHVLNSLKWYCASHCTLHFCPPRICCDSNSMNCVASLKGVDIEGRRHSRVFFSHYGERWFLYLLFLPFFLMFIGFCNNFSYRKEFKMESYFNLFLLLTWFVGTFFLVSLCDLSNENTFSSDTFFLSCSCALLNFIC